MKKTIFSLLLLGCCMAVMVSCKQEIQDVKVRVASVHLSMDKTPLSMKATLDGDTLLFSMKDARITRGLPFGGDSAIVHYIEGRGDTLRALVVSVMPRQMNVVVPGQAQGDKVVTRELKSDSTATSAE